MSSSEVFLVILLIILVAYNLYVLVRLRRYQARLKYLDSDVENFVDATGKRIDNHDALIREVREELKTLDLDNVPNADVLTSPEKK